jgi:hypothetical protein
VAIDATKPAKSKLSAQGWAWLIFWLALVAATILLTIFYPSFFELSPSNNRGGGRFRAIAAFFQRDWQEKLAMVYYAIWPIGAGLWYYWFTTRRRRQGLEAICRKLNWTLTPTPLEHEWQEDLLTFPLFQVGSDSEGSNLITGEIHGTRVMLLDYTFQMELDAFGTMQEYAQTVVVFFNAAVDVPYFLLLNRDSWWSRPASKSVTRKGTVGDLSIGNSEIPNFAKAYQVDGGDSDAIRSFFNLRRMAFFAEKPGLDLEVSPDHVLVYRERQLVKPHELAAFLKDAAEAVAILQRA